MPDGITIEIKGLDELARTLEQDLPEKMAKGIIKDAVQAGADVFVSSIESTAPVKSGELQEDITSRVTIRNESGHLRAYAFIGPGYDTSRLKVRKRGKLAGQPDSTTSPGIYAVFVEKGHGPPGSHREKQQARRKGIEIEFGSRSTAPHPFMTTAFESAKADALNAVIDKLRSGIEAAAAEVAKKP